jgi:glycosyltransferase involved in cell wall biosynthesis
MKISVIICTWNRSALLDQTLATMHKLKAPGVDWELVVVNNNCTDDTDAVVARHAGALPIRRLFETTPGKSFAANRAVCESAGELLLWTDDDVLVDPEWLREYATAAQEHPDVMFFGGQVEPWFSIEPPRWIRRNLDTLANIYALRRMGPLTRPIEKSEYPYGVNMAFRRQAFQGMSFDTQMGPKGSTRVGDEDIALIDQFRKLDYRGLWLANARLHHYIPAERLTSAYVWEYYLRYGRLAGRLNGNHREGEKLLFGMPRWAVKQYAFYCMKALLLSPFKGERWVKAIQKAAWVKGIIDERRVKA